jgi:inner membrane protein
MNTTMLSQLVYWHWFALALILGILDVTIGANFFFVWCGGAAAVVALLMLVIPTMTWEYQFLIFGIGVMGSLLFWRHYLKVHSSDKQTSTLNRRAAQYVGRVFTLEDPIVNGRGKVRIDDTLWRVEGEDRQAGEKVKVIGVDGVVLKVEKT